jgi:RNA polymerase sigma factor (sigma-70 family)
MADRESSAVLRHVRALFGAGVAGGASDGELLERFRTCGGSPDAEAAFAVLVARHGPMVLGVCRRALRDPNDASDAFQATFLVLLRKVDSVRVDGSLGRWLYGVSRRVAARARADAARRGVRTGSELGDEPAGTDPEPGAESDRRALLAALDEEISRLPAPFQTAIVLCDLGGLTHETAARQLGCPVGTIESRLSRGRRRLREQLIRRGLAPALAGPAGLSPRVVPEALSMSTVEAAAGAAAISSPVSTLIEGVLMDMAWTRIKTLTVTLGLGAVAAAFGLGIAVARWQTDDSKNNPPPPEGVHSPLPEKTPEELAALQIQLQPSAPAKPGDRLIVEVLEALPGRPISGERVVRPDGTISLSFYGDVRVAGLNRQEIKAKIVVHLLKFLTEEVLGLVETDEQGKWVKVDPKDTNRVFVDDSMNYDSGDPARRVSGRPVDAAIVQRLADTDRRLGDIETKLDGLIRAIDRTRGEKQP